MAHPPTELGGRLRRVALAFAGFGVAEYGAWTAMLVYAYGQGGATTAGLVAVVQLLPSLVVAPLAGSLADRRGGGFALRLGYAIQTAALAGTAAVLLARAPAGAAYIMATVAASAVSLTRPAQASLLVALAEHADELTRATVVTGWVESASALVGPALAGVAIAVSGPGAAFACFAVCVAGSTLLVAPLGDGPGDHELGAGREDLLAGLRVLGAQPASTALVAILAVEYVAIGALDVLAVVLAITTLGLGPSGAGYLTAAFGAGGVLGGVAALRLVGARSLGRPLLGAGAAWAAAFAILAVWQTAPVAFVLLSFAGGCRILLDTAGRTLLARVTAPDVLGRVFGVLEGLTDTGLAVGSLLVPLLVALAGPGPAVGGVAAILGLGVLAIVPRLGALDAAVPAASALRILRAHPMFAGLSAPMLESIARQLATVVPHDGEAVVREGEHGDRFYLVAGGTVDVWVGGELVGSLGPGEGFGELALLHDVPRQATVVAHDSVLLYGLAREPFLHALAPAA